MAEICDATQAQEIASLTSLEKGIAVMSAFDSARRSLGITEISRQTGLPKSTVHRILSTFVATGWVNRLANGRYQLGIKLFELGTHIYRQTHMRAVALPFLHELYHATRFNIYLSLLDGKEIVHVEHLPGARASRVTVSVGQRWALHTSSIGKLFLAYSPNVVVEEYIADGLRPLTPYSISDPAVLREELLMIRERGYAVSLDEAAVGTSGVGAPVLAPSGAILAAVCAAGDGDAVLSAAPSVVKTAAAITEHYRNPHRVRRAS